MYLIFDKNTCNSNGSLKSSTAVSVEKLSEQHQSRVILSEALKCRWQAVFAKETSSFGIVTEYVPAGVWGDRKDSTFFRLLQVYHLEDFHLVSHHPLASRPSAMPRSFLVRSKRTHLLSSCKDSFRQHDQCRKEAAQPGQHVKEQDRGRPKDAVSLTLGVTDLLAEASSPLDEMAVQLNSPTAHDPWTPGNQQLPRHLQRLFFVTVKLTQD